ncbi:MAG: hypothetical protein B6247_16160 [Candidatus Parabeggiatoa sp. nov. 2]|nr:MAG: hypothetical protein B6247_16160 [Beggiatoa sp. 4572_84]
MKKVYILFYSNSLGTREEVRDYLDSLSEVLHWRYDIPNVFYLISEENADTLAKLILSPTNRISLTRHEIRVKSNQSDFFNFWKTGAIQH